MDAAERVRAHLNAAGIACWRPGEKVGRCRAPYVVVRTGGASALSGRGETSRGVLMLYCFVPRVGGDLPGWEARVREVMRAMRDQVRETGGAGMEMLEAEYDARSRMIEYSVLRARLD